METTSGAPITIVTTNPVAQLVYSEMTDQLLTDFLEMFRLNNVHIFFLI